MAWAAKPTGKRGRQPLYSDAAVQTCLTMKVLFGTALRQTTGFVESLLQLMGLDWEVPDFSTLSRRQKTLAVNILHRGSRGPLHLLIDSTGIKVEGEGEWNARKHGGPKRRARHCPRTNGGQGSRRKVHLGIDEKTLEVRAVEIPSSDLGDAPMLPELLSQISADRDIAGVTADGAYDTRKCHDAIAERAAAAFGHSLEPVAFVPSLSPRQNAKPWKTVTAGAIARNKALRASKYLGRALWRRWSGYHRRSRAETKMMVSNCWVNASWRGTSTARSRSSRFG
jgi:hypothetical protein